MEAGQIRSELLGLRSELDARAGHAKHHAQKLNQVNMHKELGLTADETLGTLMRIDISGSSVVGFATLEYATNYGKNLRRILGSDKYVPDGLNIDVWSHAMGYLGVSLGVNVSLSIYFTSVLDYWEPIWVVKEVTTTVAGTPRVHGRHCSRRLPPKFIESTVYHYLVNTARELNHSSLSNNNAPPVLVAEYDGLVPDAVRFYREFVSRIRLLVCTLAC